jgi:hypothetical protein
LGSQAANDILNTPDFRGMLDSAGVGKLNDFLSQLGDRSAPERTDALLGQSYISQVLYTQMNDVAVKLSKDFDGSENLVDVMGHYNLKLIPLVNAFEGFHDLEDNDGDEDEDDYRLSWNNMVNPDDEIEEPDDR